MNPGKLDEPIYFESPVETNTNGDVVKTWVGGSGNTPDTPVWGMVISQKGNESFESSRNNAKQTIRVKTRYRDDVKTTWRIKWDEQYYNIVYVDRSERRDGYLWVTAEADNIT